MIGNDLVDLDAAKKQSNWRRRGYLEKIFTIAEQELIINSGCPDTMLWMLWSMKEAAYKIHNRKTGIRNFAPQKLECRIVSGSNLMHGMVIIDDEIYFTQSYIQPEYLHTISSATYSSLADIKTSIFDYPNDNFDYRRTLPDCVSHHGRYLALVYEYQR